MKLKFVQPNIENENIVARLSVGIMECGCLEWENTLVRHFIGRCLSYTAVANFAKRFWAGDGLLEVRSYENGFFFFKFSGVEFLDKILEGGP